MSLHFHRHTNYTVLVGYMEHYGTISNNSEQITAALQNTEQLVDYSLENMDIAIDIDTANTISKVGLLWLAYAKAHPEDPQGYAATAQHILED